MEQEISNGEIDLVFISLDVSEEPYKINYGVSKILDDYMTDSEREQLTTSLNRISKDIVRHLDRVAGKGLVDLDLEK